MPFLAIPLISIAGTTLLTVGGAISIGASIGLSYYNQSQQAKAAKRARQNAQSSRRTAQAGPALGPISNPSEAKGVNTDATQPEFFVYGEAEVQSSMFFYENKNAFLYYGLVIGSGLIDSVVDVKINKVSVLTTEDGYVTTPSFLENGNRLVQIETRRGFVDDPVSSILSTDFPGEWTDQHTIPAHPYVVLKFAQPVERENDQNIFQSKQPDVDISQRGKLLFDPRISTANISDVTTYTYSKNPHLAAIDFCINPQGYEHRPELHSLPNIMEMANYCDEVIDTIDGLAPRYQISGRVDLNQRPADNLGKILDCYNASPDFTANGFIEFSSPPYDEPDLVIDPEWIVDVQEGTDQRALDGKSGYEVFFISKEHGYTRQHAGTLIKEEWANERGREDLEEFYTELSPTADQSLRLAWQALHENYPDFKATIKLDHRYLKLLEPVNGKRRRTCIYEDQLMGVRKKCLIESIEEMKSDVSEATLRLVEYYPEAYTFSPKDAGFTNPIVAENLSDTGSAPGVATNFKVATSDDLPDVSIDRGVYAAGNTYPPESHVTQDGIVYYTSTGGTTTGATADVDTGITDWRTVDSSAFISFTKPAGGVLSEKRFGPVGGVLSTASSAILQDSVRVDNLVMGEDYELQVRYFSADQFPGAWETYQFTLEQQNIQPTAISAINAQGLTEAFSISILQSVYDGAYQVEHVVRADTTENFSGSTISIAGCGQAVAINEPGSPGTFWVRARSIGFDGSIGASSLPYQFVIAEAPVIDTDTSTPTTPVGLSEDGAAGENGVNGEFGEGGFDYTVQDFASATASPRNAQGATAAAGEASLSVLNDPDKSLNGEYSWNGSDWVGPRAFDETFAQITMTSSDANVLTGTLASASAQNVIVFMMVPTATNTAAVTISIDGKLPVPVRAFPGAEAPAGTLVAGKPYAFSLVGSEYILVGGFTENTIQAQAAAAAAQASATAAANSAAGNFHLGSHADDTAGSAAAPSGTPVAGMLYYDTTEEALKIFKTDWELASAATGVYTAPNALERDLREFMDEEYGVGGWTTRTGVGVGSDIGPAITRFCNAYTSRHSLVIPQGLWLWTTPVDPALMAGKTIKSYCGSQGAIVVWNNNTGSPFRMTGGAGITGGGVQGIGILLEDGFATSNSIAINCVGDASFQPDQQKYEDLYISSLGTSYWAQCLFMDGTARTSPQGIRVGTMLNVQLFRARTQTATLFGLVGWTFINFGTYAGTGALANNVYIGGGGTTATNCQSVYFHHCIVGGELNLTNANRLSLDGSCNTLVAGATCFAWGFMDSAGFTGAFAAGSGVTTL